MLLKVPTSRVMFFGGKGGVGKTTIANATALKLSSQASTLVVSTDPAHNVGHLWNTKVGDSPTTVRPGVDVMELTCACHGGAPQAGRRHDAPDDARAFAQGS